MSIELDLLKKVEELTARMNELFGHKTLSLPITCNGIDRNDFEISDDMLKLCVAALTDGSIEDTGRLTFYFSPKRWLGKNLKNILDNCGIGYSKKESKCNVFSHVNIIRLSKIDADASISLDLDGSTPTFIVTSSKNVSNENAYISRIKTTLEKSDIPYYHFTPPWGYRGMKAKVVIKVKNQYFQSIPKKLIIKNDGTWKLE